MITVDDLLLTNRRTQLSAAQRRTHLRIHLNAFVDSRSLRTSDNYWEFCQRVAQARIAATVLTRRIRVKRAPPVFTLQAAMVAWGIRPAHPNPEITYRSSDGDGHLVRFPPVTVDGFVAQPTNLRRLQRDVGERETRVSTCGVQTDPLTNVAVDVARSFPPIAAVPDVSAIMRKVTRFSRWQLAQSREAEAACRALLETVNHTMPTRFGRARARETIAASSAAAESPGEAVLTWRLHTVIAEFGSDAIAVVPQHRVVVRGRERFIDVAIPRWKLAFEFDGMEKLKAGGVDEGERIRNEWDRMEGLRGAGWEVVRFTVSELASEELATKRIRKALWLRAATGRV